MIASERASSRSIDGSLGLSSESQKPSHRRAEQSLRESTLLPLVGAPRSRRVSAAQLAAIRERLGSSALFGLQTLRDYRLLQVHHLARFLSFDGDSEAARRRCRRLLKRLYEQDLVCRLERRIGGVRAGSGGHVYGVSPLGHRLLGADKRRRWAEPSLYFVNHTLAIAELASSLAMATSVKGLGQVVETEPEVWRSYNNGLSVETLKPDLYAMVRSSYGDELHWFIEVDLHTESLGRISRKCQAYLDYFETGAEQRERSVFPRVLWVVPTRERAAQLTTVLGQERWPPGLFALALSSRATRALTDFEESGGESDSAPGSANPSQQHHQENK